MALATLVAALHVAVLARRMSTRLPAHQPVAKLAWQADGPPTVTTRREPDDAPSHLSRHFSVGRLDLTAGMAVVTLARWLHIMRVSSSIGF